MRRFLVTTLAGTSLLIAPSLRSQSASDPWEVVSRVETFRHTWLEQRDSLDVCSLEAADGFVESAGDSLSEMANAMLARWRDRRCDAASTRSRSRRVSLSSLRVERDRAQVELTVSRGERLHREVALLRRHPVPVGWTVVELRVVGLSRRILPPTSSLGGCSGFCV
jgi:hypothetical protein